MPSGGTFGAETPYGAVHGAVLLIQLLDEHGSDWPAIALGVGCGRAKGDQNSIEEAPRADFVDILAATEQYDGASLSDATSANQTGRCFIRNSAIIPNCPMTIEPGAYITVMNGYRCAAVEARGSRLELNGTRCDHHRLTVGIRAAGRRDLALQSRPAARCSGAPMGTSALAIHRTGRAKAPYPRHGAT